MLKQEYDAIVCPAFGTKNISEFNKTYGAICRHISVAADIPVYMRITSSFVYKYLENESEGIVYLDNVPDILFNKGYKRILVIPILMSRGKEFSKIKKLFDENSSLFDEICIREPLLTYRSGETAQYICSFLDRQDNKKYVLLGHGSDGKNEEYENLLEKIRECGRKDISVSLIHSFEEDGYVPEINDRNAVYCFVPLMISAGHHIQSTFDCIMQYCKECNISAEYITEGLGAVSEFSRLFY